MEKETNTVAVVDHDGSEVDSLAGVSSLKEELVRDVPLDPPHTSNLLIDVGGSPPRDLEQKKNSQSKERKEAGTELCWWENSNPSGLDLPTTKILEASTSQVPSQNIFEEKKKEEDFEESVNKFQPSTSDLAALASPVLPTSSSSLSSIYALTQVSRNNYIS